MLWVLVGLVGAIATLLTALGMIDPDGRGRFLTELVTALLSWPLALIVVGLYFRREIARVLDELAKRLADRTQPFWFNSPLGSFGVGDVALNRQAEIASPETATPEEPLPSEPRPPTDAERAQYFEDLAKQWHFAFLGQVLQPQTIAVLRWLQSHEPVTELELWLEWGRSIPDIREQAAISRALFEASLIETRADGKLSVTSYGREFSEWQLRETWRPRGGPPGNPPFTAYGIGVQPRAVVGARVRNVEVSRVTAGHDGFWLMQIPQAHPFPREGDVIHFYLNGAPTAVLETWRAGGAPRDAARGVSLG